MRIIYVKNILLNSLTSVFSLFVIYFNLRVPNIFIYVMLRNGFGDTIESPKVTRKAAYLAEYYNL